MRPSGEPTPEFDRLLQETKQYLRDPNLMLASESLEHLLRGWPDNDDVQKLLGQMASLEDVAFRAEVAPFLEQVEGGNLYAALSSLSAAFKNVTDEIAQLSDRPREILPLDESRKSADIAAIRSALSRGELEEAEARTKMAILSSPDSTDILRLEAEVAECIRKDLQVTQWLEEAERHLAQHHWKSAIRLLNSAHQLDPARNSIRERIGEAFLSWADEVRYEDLRAALKLAETAATFAPDNSRVRKIRAEIAESHRNYAVAKAMSRAKQHEAKAEFTEAENAIRDAMKELPDQLTLVLYLKELHQTRRSKQYEQELLAIQSHVLNLSSRRGYVEAAGALQGFLDKFPDSATALVLLEGVQQDHRRYQITQVTDKALEDIAALTSGNLRALKQAIDIASGALNKVGTERQLVKAREELENRLAESERNLSDFLLRAESDVRLGNFKTALESLEGAAAIDPENPRIQELRAHLKHVRNEARRNALHGHLSRMITAHRSMIRATLNRFAFAWSTSTLAISRAFKTGFARARSAHAALFGRFLASGKIPPPKGRLGSAVYSAFVKHRLIKVIATFILIAVLFGIAAYLYIQSQPEIVQLTIDSSPGGASVVINGASTGVTPYTASWELRRGETRDVLIRLELEKYEPVEEMVKISTDELRPAPLHHRLKLANIDQVIAHIYKLALGALESGALVYPEEVSVAAYLNQLKIIDPDEQYLRTERSDLRREAIRIYKDELSHLQKPERGGESELTRLQHFVRLFDSEDPLVNARIREVEADRSRQKHEIEQSLELGILLPPSPRSVLKALKDLTIQFPSESEWTTAKREEARRQLLSIAQKKCESKLPDCDQFVVSALEFFPGDVELQNSIKPFAIGDATPLDTEVQALAAKMEGALQSRRYVYPQQTSAAYFAGEILRAKPSYSRAIEVKRVAREETDKSLDQLTRAAQETKALQSLDDARVVLADFRRAQNLLDATLRFWPDDTKVRRQASALRERILDVDRLTQEHEFPVVHDHVIGDCRGLLSISAFRVKYILRGNGSDGFDRPLNNIRFPIEVRGDAIELAIDSRVMRFKVEVGVSNLGTVTVIRSRMNDVREARSRIETKQTQPASVEK